MGAVRYFFSELGERLGELLFALLCVGLFGVVALLAAWAWYSGLTVVAISIAVVWAVGSIPWLSTVLVIGFDLVHYVRSGHVYLIPFLEELCERSETDSALRSVSADPGVLSKALTVFSALTSPLTPLVVAGVNGVTSLPSDAERVGELLDDVRRIGRTQRRSRKVRRSALKLSGNLLMSVRLFGRAYLH